MNYRFRATEEFWRSFHALPAQQKDSVRRVWAVFKLNPFDPRLGTHKIHRLSARYRTTVYSVVIEADLRAVFMLQGDLVLTLDLGTHDIYR